MLSYFQAAIFGSLQGITELFPISSLGHSVILPSVLGWNINQKDPFFLTFLVATHFATSLVLFVFFFKEWKKIIGGIFSSLKNKEIKTSDEKLGWLLIVGTIPAGILGLLFEDYLKELFASPQIVAAVLILNGLMLVLAEILVKKSKNQKIAGLSYFETIKIGVLQCIALIPGFSRTGSTITGGLLVGLSHEDAARFSFLLATPIIGAAAALKLPELLTQTGLKNLGQTLFGSLFAAIFAYFSVKFLTKFFENKKLTIFAVYCILIGILVSLKFLV